MGTTTHSQSPSDTPFLSCLDWLFDRGWQPADIVHVARRHTTQRQARLVVAALAHHSRLNDAPTRAPHAWVRQLVALGIYHPETQRIVGGHADFKERWAKAEQLDPDDAQAEALAVYLVIATAPSLAPTMPTPKHWGATNVGLPADPVMGVADDKVLRTIRALLAKAEATDFEAEAEAFTTKAQSLMTRHSIDSAMLAAAAHGVATPGVLHRRLHIDAPYADEKSALVAVLAEVNGVKCVWSPWCGFCSLVGFPVDLQLVEVLFTSLLLQATHASAAATAADRRRSTRSFKRAFMVAFADRIAERLVEAARISTQSAVEQYGSALAPVLANKTAAVDQAFAAAFPDITYAKPKRYNADGWWAGRAAADRADLGVGAALPRSR